MQSSNKWKTASIANLMGKSHEKVSEMRPWNISLDPN
jgi:hypothetical protein